MKKAVLIIHGFAGGTYDEESLAIYLELKGYDVYNFTLPGHDRLLFNKATKEDWIKCCEEHLELLIKNRYRRIYVVGHSMGGVLASYLASKYKEVTKLILAAPAFKYMTFGKENFELLHALRNSPKLIKDYGKEEVISRAVQFPASVVKEFMKLVDESKDLPSKIKCPVLIIHGNDDKIVPIESSKNIFNEFQNKRKYFI